MTDRTDILLHKLDQFIRKYYKNQLIKGSILSGALLVLAFVLLTISEYFGYFASEIRTVMFFVFIGLSFIILTNYIFIPIAGFLKIGKHINHEQASRIIGEHFPDVKDHLLNTLQLKELSRSDRSALLIASINQRTEELRPVPFTNAINFKANKKYIKYLVVPMSILGIMILASPTSVTEPTKRLIKYNEHFEKPLPYEIKLKNTNLEVIQQEDFVIEVEADGEEIPKDLYVETRDGKFRMNNHKPGSYSHKIKNVQKDITFRIRNHQYESKTYKVRVLPKPTILSFNIQLDYPKYTGRKDETIENKGDMIVPEGTKATWNFFTRDTETIFFRAGKDASRISSKGSNKFSVKRTLGSNTSYVVKSKNQYLESKDSLVYSISIVKDNYPQIEVKEYRDSTQNRRLYFDGFIEDDYGFTDLKFFRKKEDEKKYSSTDIKLGGASVKEQFFHFIDLKSVELKPGETLEYFFKVWDNDQVNGYKSAKTPILSYRAPTEKEIERESEKQREKIESDLEKTIKDVENLNKEIDDIREKLINKEELNWEDKKNIKDLLNKRENLSQKLKELSELNKEKFKKESRFNEQEQRIMEKQRQLEELFDKVLDEEMKEKMKELQRMIDSLNKDQMQEKMDELKFDNEELEKQLDRNLELFKQFEFEKKLEESIKDLKELAKKQKELKKKTEEGKSEKDSLRSAQDSLNKEFGDYQKDLEELEKMNDDLQYPNNFKRDKNKEEAIDQEMRNSSQELQEGNMENAEQSQQNAAEMMEQMQQMMSSMQQSMMMQGMTEDMRNLRQQLENIVQLSFDQENLIDKLKSTSSNDPKYLDIIDKQNEISDELAKVKDSLYALSKRQVMIEPFINKQISNIERDYDKVLDALQNRRVSTARSKQQYVMSSLNKLALFMSEMMNRMQQQMSMMSQGQGNQSCPTPGMGKPSMKSIRQMQQQLNQQMQQMKEGLKKGKSPGGQNMSKQLAKMSAQQEQIRRMMEKYKEQLKEEGKGYGGNMDKAIKDMEETETDLVNRMITNETLKRQKEILTRLLKSEKAERQREKEKRRKSVEAEEYEISTPPELKQFEAEQRNETEMLRTVPPKLKAFYKSKVNTYFYNFNGKDNRNE
ncbi:MAG: hypothetical protein K9I94_05975 [Bacteroidales bacterium]|nr:hypothetical protein [Bacteroidales bacterium]